MSISTSIHSFRPAKSRVGHSLSCLFLALFSFFFIFSCSCAPVVEGKNFTVCDNISANQVIGTIPASAPEGQNLTYRLTADAGGLFEIDGDGKISLASGKDLSFTNTNRHVITVEVSNTASPATSTADVTIDVITTPLLLNNVVSTWGSNVSLMVDKSGGTVKSFTVSNDPPSGLAFVNNNGQLFLEGTPAKVTLITSDAVTTNTNSNVTNFVTHVIVGSRGVRLEVANQCGESTATVEITIHPQTNVQGDLSPDVVHEWMDSASNNPPEQIFKVTNIPFANSGTGAYDDPIIIALADGATNISFVLDFGDVRVPVDDFDSRTNVQEQSFHILWLNLPENNFEIELTQISALSNQLIELYGGNIQIISPLRISAYFQSIGVFGISQETPMRLSTNSLKTIIAFRNSGVHTPLSNYETGQFRFTLENFSP